MAELHEADGVFQGGGVKGIALVGALLGFAEHGWTDWHSVAGTSAGSIIAAYLACGHGADDLEKLLRKTPYEKFQDWGAGGKIIGGGLNLVRHHGLAHGEYFHNRPRCCAKRQKPLPRPEGFLQREALKEARPKGVTGPTGADALSSCRTPRNLRQAGGAEPFLRCYCLFHTPTKTAIRAGHCLSLTFVNANDLPEAFQR